MAQSVLWTRIRWAAALTAQWAQTLRFIGAALLIDAGIAYAFSQSARGLQGAAVIVSVLAGFLIVLTLLFLYAFFTIPRRSLEFRVGELESTAESHRRQLSALATEKWGEPDRFIPVYHDLCADLREAKLRVQHAEQSGRLWGFTERLDDKTWKQNKAELASNPWAQLDDVYGVLAEAYSHVDRLNSARSTRWVRAPQVRSSDDLPAALRAFDAATTKMEDAIEEANPDQLELGEGD